MLYTTFNETDYALLAVLREATEETASTFAPSILACYETLGVEPSVKVNFSDMPLSGINVQRLDILLDHVETRDTVQVAFDVMRFSQVQEDLTVACYYSTQAAYLATLGEILEKWAVKLNCAYAAMSVYKVQRLRATYRGYDVHDGHSWLRACLTVNWLSFQHFMMAVQKMVARALCDKTCSNVA